MKSLEERVADRQRRKEEAQKTAEENGTAMPTNDKGDGDGDGESYSDWTVAELKEELDNREIAYTSSAVKADLVKLLEDNDAEG